MDGQDWAPGLAAVAVLGFSLVGLYGLKTGDEVTLVVSLLLSGACLLVGIFLGFLFGIPRSLQNDTPQPTEPVRPSEIRQEGQGRRIEYRANTNLEQISDWLTKILVGVGLTQLSSLPDFFVRIGAYFGKAIGPSERAPQIAIAIVILFVVCGFLIGYLWTRLFLGSELARADLKAVTEQIHEVREAQEMQAQIDAKAIGLTNQYLSQGDADKISIEALKSAIMNASAPVKVQIYYQARELRTRSWQLSEDKWLMQRTIPIFEALIASDKEGRFHKNHAQLGFALKDKRNPDYARAEAELTTAIELRGPAAETGGELYEFNRAICRIKQDEEFASGQASRPESRAKILSDIKTAANAFPDLLNEPDIIKWLHVNSIKNVLDEAERGTTPHPT
ncbi:hypothetical protein [Bradyrhizobium oligotrophicum]|uniref:hypothetical protein n=1 Tax=Bradyrhizobium oligotrophicum TaxID=44255 RepID=UPI003EBCA4DC